MNFSGQNAILAALTAMIGQNRARSQSRVEALQTARQNKPQIVQGKDGAIYLYDPATQSLTPKEPPQDTRKPIEAGGNVLVPVSPEQANASAQADLESGIQTATDAAPDRPGADYYDKINQMIEQAKGLRSSGYQQILSAPEKLQSIGPRGSMDSHGNIVTGAPPEPSPLDPVTAALREAQTDLAKSGAERNRNAATKGTDRKQYTDTQGIRRYSDTQEPVREGQPTRSDIKAKEKAADESVKTKKIGDAVDGLIADLANPKVQSYMGMGTGSAKRLFSSDTGMPFLADTPQEVVDFTTKMDLLRDAIQRKQSGHALNKTEIELYKSITGGLRVSPATLLTKLNAVKAVHGTSGVTPAATLTSDEQGQLDALVEEAKANGGELSEEKAAIFNALKNKKARR